MRRRTGVEEPLLTGGAHPPFVHSPASTRPDRRSIFSNPWTLSAHPHSGKSHLPLPPPPAPAPPGIPSVQRLLRGCLWWNPHPRCLSAPLPLHLQIPHPTFLSEARPLRARATRLPRPDWHPAHPLPSVTHPLDAPSSAAASPALQPPRPRRSSALLCFHASNSPLFCLLVLPLFSLFFFVKLIYLF